MAQDPACRGTLERNIARGSAVCVRVGGTFAGGMWFRNGGINWLGVRGQGRRRGVGSAVITDASAHGAAEVRVTRFGDGHPHPASGAAGAVYHRMGFQPACEEPELVAAGTPWAIVVWRQP